MIIRSIRLKESEDFLELCKKIDASGFMLFEPGERQITVEQQQNTIKRILFDTKSVTFVAEIDDKLVGFLTAIGGNAKRIQHRAFLVLGVDEDYHGKGIATSLFHHVFSWAEEEGISRLELTVIKHNTKAFNLYRNMGFVLEGEKVNSLMIDGEPVNEYYLYKLL